MSRLENVSQVSLANKGVRVCWAHLHAIVSARLLGIWVLPSKRCCSGRSARQKLGTSTARSSACSLSRAFEPGMIDTVPRNRRVIILIESVISYGQLLRIDNIIEVSPLLKHVCRKVVGIIAIAEYIHTHAERESHGHSRQCRLRACIGIPYITPSPPQLHLPSPRCLLRPYQPSGPESGCPETYTPSAATGWP